MKHIHKYRDPIQLNHGFNLSSKLRTGKLWDRYAKLALKHCYMNFCIFRYFILYVLEVPH